jgi:hypothetical protein
MKDGMPVAQSEQRAPAGDMRSVTILGATGSIGTSTIDLLKRERAALSRRSLDREHERSGALPRSRVSSAPALRRSAIPPPIARLGCAVRLRHRGGGRRGAR